MSPNIRIKRKFWKTLLACVKCLVGIILERGRDTAKSIRPKPKPKPTITVVRPIVYEPPVPVVAEPQATVPTQTNQDDPQAAIVQQPTTIPETPAATPPQEIPVVTEPPKASEVVSEIKTESKDKPTPVSGNSSFTTSLLVILGFVLLALIAIAWFVIPNLVKQKTQLSSFYGSHWGNKTALWIGGLVLLAVITWVAIKIIKSLMTPPTSPSKTVAATAGTATQAAAAPTTPAAPESPKGTFDKLVSDAKKTAEDHKVLYSLLVIPVWIVFMLAMLLCKPVLGWWDWYWENGWLILITPTLLTLFAALWLVKSKLIKFMSLVFFLLPLILIYAFTAQKTLDKPLIVIAPPDRWSEPVKVPIGKHLDYNMNGCIKIQLDGIEYPEDCPGGDYVTLPNGKLIAFMSTTGKDVEVEYVFSKITASR